MAMTAGDYADQLVELLPSGPAWPNEGSQSSRMLSGLAAELARIDGRVDALLDEVDPRTVIELIDEWELVSGTTGSTLVQRRAALHARMISLGGQSRAYFITLAGALGYTITIEELQPFRASKNRVGDVIAVPGVVYAWRVSVLGSPAAPDLEALFRDLKPAHTAVTFVYPAESIAGALSGSITVGSAPSLTGRITLVNARVESFVPIAARAGTCGVFSLTSDGVWIYVLDSHDPDAVALPAKATLSDSVTVVASDGSITGSVVVTVIGIDDPGTIGGTDTGSTVEDVTTSCSGVLTVTDPDTGEAVFVAQTTSSSYGTFVLQKSGSWSYALGAGAQALAAGSTVSDTFTARSVGGASHVVSITITGTNDVPTISGATTGSLTVGLAATVSGALTISDPDTGESAFVARTTAGAYGSFVLAASGAWTYTLDGSNATVKSLAVGATVTDAFSAVSADGSASKTVTITIVGQARADAYSANVTLLVAFSAAGGAVDLTGRHAITNTGVVSADGYGVFDGSINPVLDHYLRIPASVDWEMSGPWTIEVLIEKTAVYSDGSGGDLLSCYVGSGITGSGPGWVLSPGYNGTILTKFAVSDMSGIQLVNNGQGYGGGYADVGKVHYELSFDGTHIYMFINGKPSMVVTGAAAIPAIAADLLIGKNMRYGNYFKNPKIYGVRITKGVCRHSATSTSMTPQFTPPTSFVYP